MRHKERTSAKRGIRFQVERRSGSLSRNQATRGTRLTYAVGSLLVLAKAALFGCQPPPAPETSPNPPGAAEQVDARRSNASPASASPPSPVNRSVPTSAPEKQVADTPAISLDCPGATCTEYPSTQAALRSLITERTRLIAFGEAHAPADFRGDTTVQRFMHELLPELVPRSGFLLVELLAPQAGCDEATEQVQQESNAVTQGQASTNQNEYVALGHQARQLGLPVDILRPNCEQLRSIASSELGVVTMMETIAQLSTKVAREELDRARETGQLVLLYGGALHNDVLPRSGMETWSYGPALASELSAGYLELDLVLPALMRDTDSWKKFRWYQAARSLPAAHGPVLIQLDRNSAALVFAAGDSSSAP